VSPFAPFNSVKRAEERLIGENRVLSSGGNICNRFKANSLLLSANLVICDNFDELVGNESEQ